MGVDLCFAISAFFSNPYRVCRKFTGAHGYGETPLSTFAQLAKCAGLAKGDLFLDLGCGRGKLCFWASLWIGCSSEGVEQVPKFVKQARGLAKLFRVPSKFYLGVMEEADLSKATVVYLYAMEWDERVLLGMRQGARLITVGAPFEGEGFEMVEAVRVKYPWGTTDAFIQKRGSG